MPSAQEYTTIGHLYEAVRANLIALDHRLGSKALFLGAAASQVGKDAINLDGVTAITDLASATTAIDVIVEQGEGSPTDRDASHYRKFLSVQDELVELTRLSGDLRN